jgi:3-hydroxybutyryl-CoA dehydrogenase
MEQGNEIFFDKAAVIGIKRKSQQIAETLSSSGIEVILWGPTKEQTDEAIEGIGKSIDNEIQRWGMTESDKRAIIARIKPTTEISDIKDCKVIIEAMGVNLEQKQEALQQVSECNPDLDLYIIHISTLSVTEIAGSNKIRNKVIGMHFLEPVPKIPVVELVRGMHTEDRTVTLAKEFAKRLNKTSVEVFEYPGYITNRVMLPMINEAIYVLMEGISSAEDIDTAIKLGFNLPIGPLALADTLGLDEVLRRMENLFHELGDAKYRPCPLLRKMVRAGRLGLSTNEGFFKYEKKDELY